MITKTDNIGIGTTNPSEKLHVNGNIKANGCILSPNGAYKLCIQDDGNLVTYNVSTGVAGWNSGVTGY